MKPEDFIVPEGGSRGDRILLGRMLAVFKLLERTGIREAEVAYEEEPIRWWAGGNWNGTRVFSEKFPYPAQACEDLLARVLNGGMCKRCQQTTIIGVIVGGLCSFVLGADDVDDPHSYRYMRTCSPKGG